MKVAFISNICPHYRVKTYEIMARVMDVDFYFFSAGDEWYWQQQHGVKRGEFHSQYLKGFYLGRTRITPGIIPRLLSGGYDVYIKCINGRFILPITYLIARLRRKPFILWTGIWMRLQSRAHRLFYPVTRYLYTHSDAVVVYGEHVKRFLVAEGVQPEKIFVTTHAVDNEFFVREVSEEEKSALRERLGISADQKVVLYLGRLEEIKGLPEVIQAFAWLPETQNAVLVLAGEGSMRGELEKQVESLEIQDRVRFAGYTQQADSVAFYAIADVFVLNSVTTPQGKETWGLVVNEAMLQGVPVVASDAVGAAAGGLVRDGWNGYIVPEGNIQSLSDAISRVLQDPALREQMSRNAREIMKDWNNETMVASFRQAVEYVLKKKYR